MEHVGSKPTQFIAHFWEHNSSVVMNKKGSEIVAHFNALSHNLKVIKFVGEEKITSENNEALEAKLHLRETYRIALIFL